MQAYKECIKWTPQSIKKQIHLTELTCAYNIDRIQDNLVLSTGLIMWIGHHKEIWKLTFQALALQWNEMTKDQCAKVNQQRANIIFRISLWWPIHIINPADKTKFITDIL